MLEFLPMKTLFTFARTLLARNEGPSLVDDLVVLALVAVAVAACVSQTPAHPPESSPAILASN